MPMIRRFSSCLLVAGPMLWGTGCTKQPAAQPMTRDQFYRNGGISESPLSPTDQPGAIVPRDTRGAKLPLPPPAPVTSAPVRIVPATAPAPATQGVHVLPRVGDPTGKYWTVGGVVADVNGTPIYADKVLASLEKALKAQSAEMDEKKFRDSAKQMIGERVESLVRSELVYAAAQRHLSDDERQLADLATERWRQRKITEAGGSIELARRIAASQGDDFDEMVKNKAREHMVQLYWERKIKPRVLVTASDMRRYYNQNRDSLYTRHEELRFRVLKIDPANHGAGSVGRDKALDKIQDLRRRAVAGESFEDLARDYGEDAKWMKDKGGDVGWIKRGAYKLSAIEDAVWKLQVGQVTDVMEAENAFYLAKLEERKPGGVTPFEAERVQEEIRETLQSQQLRELREIEETRLRQAAIERRNPEQMESVLEMAMQKYAQWTKR